MKLRIKAVSISIEIALADTPTAKALHAAAPFGAKAQTWGEEVYFSTPVSAELESNARQVVEAGTACFWVEGNAIALPFGRTPISTDARPKLASRCNVIGQIEGDSRVLAKVRAGDPVTVDKA
jgi:hypothetical protein